MMRTLLVVSALVQFAQRPPLAPAETLLAPALLAAIRDEAVKHDTPGASKIAGRQSPIEGANAAAGEIVLGSEPGNGGRRPGDADPAGSDRGQAFTEAPKDHSAGCIGRDATGVVAIR